jgi:hypothetical protein
VLRYGQHVVSLLVTADRDRAAGAALSDLAPRLHGAPISGLSVASIRTAHHAILLVSDMRPHELTQLSKSISVPLAEQLASVAMAPARSAPASIDPRDAAVHAQEYSPDLSGLER